MSVPPELAQSRGTGGVVDTPGVNRFYSGMKKMLCRSALAAFLALLSSSVLEPARAAVEARTQEKADVLPLALDDSFEFRKVNLFFNDVQLQKNAQTQDEMMNFERARVNYRAVSNVDRRAREGNYFTFSWRAKRASNLTFRLEYRQEKLGSFVQSKEISYPNVKGSVNTKMSVIGDDYREDGRVIAWRAVLIENGRIVGLTQSFLWN